MLVAIHILPVVLLHLLAATLGMKIVRLTKVLTVGSEQPRHYDTSVRLLDMVACSHAFHYLPCC